MARFLVATMPIAGHVAPFIPVVRRLAGAGHEVLWYGSVHHRDRIEDTGAKFAPMERAIDYGDGDLDRYFPERAAHKGLRQVIHDFDVMFVGELPNIIDDLVDLERSFGPDVLLHDPAIPGVLAERVTGVPGAQLNITVPAFKWPGVPPFGLGLPFAPGRIGRLRDRLAFELVDRVAFRRPNATFRRIARTRGWPVQPVRPILSEYLNLQPSVPEMDYPVTPWPDTLHFIGPLPPESGPFTPPPWWEEMIRDSRRVILVTQGTVATDPTQLIIPALRAFADDDVLLIAATGGPTAAELGAALGSDLPANARVEPFIPFVELMPHVDAFVTNGGFGGVSTALAHGVPIVVAGRTEDKAEVAARVAHSGAGVNLRSQQPSSRRLRRAVRRVLDEDGYRSRAGRVRASMATHDAPGEAVQLLEKLAGQRPWPPSVAAAPAGTTV